MALGSLIGAGASLLGGLLGGKKDKRPQQTVVQGGIPREFMPYVQTGLDQAQSAFFPGSTTVAGMDPRELRGIAGATNLADTGGALVAPAVGYAQDVLGGRYLEPESLQRASQYAINQFLPRVTGDFESIGRTGSGLAARAAAEGVSDIVAREYGRERNRMQSVMSQAPMLESLAYSPYGRLMDLGDRLQAQQQRYYDDPQERAMRYSQTVGGLLSPGRVGQNQTYFGPSTGERIAGIGNLAGGFIDRLGFGGGDSDRGYSYVPSDYGDAFDVGPGGGYTPAGGGYGGGFGGGYFTDFGR